MIIDAFAFARNAQELFGDIPIASMTRLEVLKHDGSLQYQLRGYQGELGRSFLDLKVNGQLVLRCERCLQPLDWPIDVHSVLWLAPGEAEADAEPVDQDAYDPVVGSDHFDVNLLVEDEVLLAIPVGPKHDHCPDGLIAPKEGRQSPFAALAALRKGGSEPPRQ